MPGTWPLVLRGTPSGTRMRPPPYYSKVRLSRRPWLATPTSSTWYGSGCPIQRAPSPRGGRVPHGGASVQAHLTWPLEGRAHGGATTIVPDATQPPAICQNLRGGGVGAGGDIGSSAGGGLRPTHYYHMHTARVCVCLGAWGYRGMYAIIAISRLCQEESLKGLKDQRHSTPFN